MQNPGKLMKSVAQMQKRVTTIQAEIQQSVYDGSSGGGLVKLKLKGDGEMTALEINPEAMAEGAELLSDLVKAAYNSAQTAKELDSKAKLKTVSAGLLPMGFNIPGLGNLLIRGVLTRDYFVVQAVTLILAFGVVLSNFIVDVLTALLDPRVKL